MGLRAQSLGVFLALFQTGAVLADANAITAVARTLPTPDAPVLPELPPHGGTAHRALSVSVTDSDRIEIPRHHWDLSAFGLPCGAQVVADRAGERAHRIQITAPCRPHQLAAVEINGLTFDMRLSLTGSAAVELPALVPDAKMQVTFEDGTRKTVPLPQTDLTDVIRVGISWSHGDTHLTAKGLDVTRVGTGPRKLDIVSSGMIGPASQTIRMSLKRNVTTTGCGHAEHGQVFRQTGTDPALRYSLTLAPVECGRVGEILVLKNILEDLKLAAN